MNTRSNIRLETENRKVNAKSIMQILSMGFKTGTEVTIVAEGSDAQEAVETIREFIDAGCPEL
ncbi:MAG: HPr family phosphocarrier protein [Selenomonadaceae bacterium]|nr:HPr family phosphocarrier protein [Selenomonadaceae bacterium]